LCADIGRIVRVVMKFDFEKYRWLETIEEDQLALDKKGTPSLDVTLDAHSLGKHRLTVSSNCVHV
jgi:hypothetical protein